MNRNRLNPQNLTGQADEGHPNSFSKLMSLHHCVQYGTTVFNEADAFPGNYNLNILPTGYSKS